MKSEHKQFKISDFADVIGGGTPSTKIEEYYGGDIPWLTPKDMSTHNSKYIEVGSRSITDLGLKKSSAKIVPKGTVLFTSRAPIGYIAIANKEVSTNQGFKSLICNDKIAHNEYIYYLLKSKVSAIESIASGSTFKEVSGSVLKDFIVELPPLQTQKKIAHILSTLDDKIELNRKMNQTLEEMAQTLFKSWFVDFDPVKAKASCSSDEELEAVAKELGISKEILKLFPSEFEDSELGMIPKGWKVESLASICSVQSGYAFKGSWWQDTGIKVIKIKNINGTEVDTNDCQCVSEEIATKNQKFILKHGDCLIAMTGATVGKVGIIDTSKENFLLNQRVGRFQPKEYYDEYIKTLVKTNKFFESIQSEAQGSAQPNISTKEIEATTIIKPNGTIIQAFSMLMQPLYFKMLSHQSEITTLQKTQDTLLPKLLSGEIDVSNIEVNL